MSTLRIANIIIVSTNATYLKSFSTQLEQHNFNILPCDHENFETKAKTTYPDLVIIDVSCDDFDGFEATLKLKNDRTTKHIPVAILTDEKSETLYLHAAKIKADGIFSYNLDIKELIIYIKPLLRLSPMFSELEHRVKLAAEFGVSAKSEIKNDDDAMYQILLIVPKDGDKATFETVLEGNCIIEVCTDFFAAEDRLTHGVFDAAICSLDKENYETVLSLSSRVKNNPDLFNLPLIVMSEGHIKDRMEAYRRGVRRIVKRPLNQSSLKAEIKMLIRRQRLRWNIRNAMDTTRQGAIIDPTTNAYKADFFNKHLSTQVKHAHKWQKQLAVIFFSIPNMPSIQQQFGEASAKHLIQQIYQWIANLTRVEDLVARSGDHEFCIALPDTPIEEAQIIRHRIAGILSYTDFDVIDIFQPISIWIESGTSTVEIGDDAQTLIDRTRNTIN